MTMVAIFFAGLALGGVLVFLWTAPPLPGEEYPSEFGDGES